ncbi:low molecular weight phosphatase family protein [Mycolicibacterium brumae]|uniref:arsenate-mycothiol transferase ArsC n=1 Tax=Mycolicibacterium brumae TaxID=85968 RepID=UPI000A981BB4|nr:hypothetical protein [Mycolicibacterium brumae]MCV7192776.1 hypothetical protein [Mycolicibacterium brumae]RWA23365.1 hypothetical protein MBRU_00675 [Mycolicibacterium brumae DSM 44177]UWW08706.1 hypothetical protein L2Z93_001769 [Mycolicibacterium brumae]
MADTTVLFVCVSNAGKSVMAAGLMRHAASPNIRITSAGTHAKTAVNQLSAQALAEIGVDISGHQPVQLILNKAMSLVVITAAGPPPAPLPRTSRANGHAGRTLLGRPS